jgi:hypothetical protein
MVIGRVVNEAVSFEKDSLNRSMKKFVPTIGPNTDCKQWKRKFLAK